MHGISEIILNKLLANQVQQSIADGIQFDQAGVFQECNLINVSHSVEDKRRKII